MPHYRPRFWLGWAPRTAVRSGRGEYRSIPFRYVWPSELDLMARLAGMRLRDRWEDWNRAPFTGDSRQHVSVWEKV